MADVVPGENSRRRPRLRRRARRIRNPARSFWHAAPRVARRTRARVTTRGGPGVEVWLVRWSYTLWRVRVSAGASGTRGTVAVVLEVGLAAAGLVPVVRIDGTAG